MTKIKIYSTPYCGYCKMAKDFFDKNGISYEEIDVSVDEAAARQMIEKTNQMGVPVIEIGDEYVVGFNRPLIEEMIAKQSKSE